METSIRVIPRLVSIFLSTSRQRVYLKEGMGAERIQPVFMPSGVADADKQVGYVGDSAAGVNALDLRTGESLWTSDVLARPLIVQERRLAALRSVAQQANNLQIIVLDRYDRGKVLLESDPIRFPGWAYPTIVPAATFRYQTCLEEDELLLEWEAHAMYRGGAPPPPHIQAQANQAAAGVARIDLRTGKVQMLPLPRKGEMQRPPELQNENLFSYQQGPSDTWETDPWVVDDVLAAISGEIIEEQQVLKLQRWNRATGEMYEPATLVQDEALVSYVTPDGSFVFIHSEKQPEAAAGVQGSWWLFSAATAERIAVLGYEKGTREACVLNSTVYYIVENPPVSIRRGGEIPQSTMTALDIGSGKRIWQRALSPRRTTKPPARRQQSRKSE
jgi:hypothetical protein